MMNRLDCQYKIARIVKRFKFLIMIVVLIITTGCYAFINDSKEIGKNNEVKYYTFDPETVIDSLEKGQADIFTLQETNPKVTSSTSLRRFSFTQDDYYDIAKTLHQIVWQDPLGAENLFHISLEMNCSEIDQSTFSEVLFISYKVMQSGKEETRVERSIRIRPLEHIAITSKIEYSPNRTILKPIDLRQYPVSAEHALQIAETNGGAEQRLGSKNACLINALAPGSDRKGWHIIYLNINNKIERLFEIAIDPETGKFKILESKR